MIFLLLKIHIKNYVSFINIKQVKFLENLLNFKDYLHLENKNDKINLEYCIINLLYI